MHSSMLLSVVTLVGKQLPGAMISGFASFIVLIIAAVGYHQRLHCAQR